MSDRAELHVAELLDARDRAGYLQDLRAVYLRTFVLAEPGQPEDDFVSLVGCYLLDQLVGPDDVDAVVMINAAVSDLGGAIECEVAVAQGAYSTVEEARRAMEEACPS